jgi:hypothetical protein
MNSSSDLLDEIHDPDGDELDDEDLEEYEPDFDDQDEDEEV